MKIDLYNIPRFRKFSVRYVGPSMTRPSRIRIIDERHKLAKVVVYDSEIGDLAQQAACYLKKVGISVDGMALGNLDSEVHLLSQDFATPLK
jgi:hypothetical protein